MRTLTLELLRHGPSHNQLLSPLTPYLALCENHAPVTLNVPFEHNQFLHRLSALTYELNEKHRHFQLQDTGRELGRILSAIPGLTAELSRQPGQAQQAVTHLRLILSASELALLPFELATAGNGFPGAGQPLLLQSEMPICLTREVRRVNQVPLQWDCDPRVLFICASPGDLPPVPVESHLLALRRAVDPWVGYFDPSRDEERKKEVDRRLRVLPRASIQAIEEECATGKYTHVHILAHGVARKAGFDVRFGLALHDDDAPDGEPDVVSGERLATALRAMQRPDRTSLVRPLVVTLASYNSGNVGTVAGVGASVAHALQEAGIPLVVAGQFPLTFRGSVQLVERMYEGLLWGADPRELLMELRRRLHTQRPTNHDWAALTAYASLPPDFDDQLLQAQLESATEAVETSMNYADKATQHMMKDRRPTGSGSEPGAAIDPAAREEVLEKANAKIGHAKARLEWLFRRAPERMRHEILGLLASADKRHAEVCHWMAKVQAKAKYDAMVRPLLRSAEQQYWKCFRARPDMVWAMVQYLSLRMVLRDSFTATPQEAAGARLQAEAEKVWSAAMTLSRNELDASDQRAGWALGNLIELCLLGILLKKPQDLRADPDNFVAEAEDYVEQIAMVQATSPFQIYSTRRQLVRYAEWYPSLAPSFGVVSAVSEQLLANLPEDNTDARVRRRSR